MASIVDKNTTPVLGSIKEERANARETHHSEERNAQYEREQQQYQQRNAPPQIQPARNSSRYSKHRTAPQQIQPAKKSGTENCMPQTLISSTFQVHVNLLTGI